MNCLKVLFHLTIPYIFVKEMTLLVCWIYIGNEWWYLNQSKHN